MKLTFWQKVFGATLPEEQKTEVKTVIRKKEVDQLAYDPIDKLIEEKDHHVHITKTPIIDKTPDQIVKEAIGTEVDFKVLKEINNSTFEVDKQNGISRIVWDGAVNLSTVRELVTMGADSVEFYGYKKLLIDRSKLEEFDTEARLWIKGMLKTRAKKIAKMVDRLAIVKSKSSKGSIFSHLISSAINLIMPNLEMQKFEDADEAIDWLK